MFSKVKKGVSGAVGAVGGAVGGAVNTATGKDKDKSKNKDKDHKEKEHKEKKETKETKETKESKEPEYEETRLSQVVRKPLRGMLSAAHFLRERAIQHGYEGDARGELYALGFGYYWELLAEDAEEEGKSDEDKEKQTRMRKWVTSVADKLVEWTATMAMEADAQGIRAFVGSGVGMELSARATLPISFALELYLDSPSVIKALREKKTQPKIEEITDDEEPGALFGVEEKAEESKEAPKQLAHLEVSLKTIEVALEHQLPKEALCYLTVKIGDDLKRSAAKHINSGKLDFAGEKLSFEVLVDSQHEYRLPVMDVDLRVDTSSLPDSGAMAKMFRLVASDIGPSIARSKTPINEIAPQSKDDIDLELEFQTETFKSLKLGSLSKSDKATASLNVNYLKREAATSSSLVTKYLPWGKKKGASKEEQIEDERKKRVLLRMAARAMAVVARELWNGAKERKLEGEVWCYYSGFGVRLSLEMIIEYEKEESVESVETKVKSDQEHHDAEKKEDELDEEEKNKLDSMARAAVRSVTGKIFDAILVGTEVMRKKNRTGTIYPSIWLEFPMLPISEISIGYFIMTDSVKPENFESKQDNPTEQFEDYEFLEYQKTAKSKKKGCFKVRVVQAKGIQNVTNVFGKISFKKHSASTDTKHNTTTPVFNETFFFSSSSAPTEFSVSLQSKNVLQNSQLGTAHVRIDPSAIEGQKVVSGWYPLEGKDVSGEVQLVFQYHPDYVAPPADNPWFTTQLARSVTTKVRKGVSNTGTVSTRSIFKVLMAGCMRLDSVMRRKNYSGESWFQIDALNLSLALIIRNEHQEAEVPKTEEEKKEHEKKQKKQKADMSRTDKVIDAVINQLMRGAEIGAEEVQKKKADAILRHMVSAGLPFPFPDWFSLTVYLCLYTQGVNPEKIEAIRKQRMDHNKEKK